jgi:predicted outer membrane repeat protein
MPRHAATTRERVARAVFVALVALACVRAASAATVAAFSAETFATSGTTAAAYATAPAGGRDGAAWYAATAWHADWYTNALGVDRGRSVTVRDAATLEAALRDPLVEFIVVNASEITLDAASWPAEGALVRRRVSIASVQAYSAVVIYAGGMSVANVVDGGTLTVTDVRVQDAIANVGGAFYFGRAHGGGAFNRVVFTNNTAGNGGAVFVASDMNSGNVTFYNCSFDANHATATGGRGGAAFVSSDGPAGVGFTLCTFKQNTATTGYGGAIYAEGGYVAVNECVIDGNAATGGGGATFRGGGIISRSTFKNNNATVYMGGGLHITSASGDQVGTYGSTVQRSTFSSNSAIQGGAGVFAYGLVKLLANSYTSNAIPNDAAFGLDPNYYVCTDTEITGTGCAMRPEIVGDLYDPAKFDPFLPETEYATIPAFTT